MWKLQRTPKRVNNARNLFDPDFSGCETRNQSWPSKSVDKYPSRQSRKIQRKETKHRNEGQISKRNSVADIYDRASVIQKHIRPNISKEQGSRPVTMERVSIKRINFSKAREAAIHRSTTIGFAVSLSFGSNNKQSLSTFRRGSSGWAFETT